MIGLRMKVEKANYNYSPVSITFETHEEYRDFKTMLNFVYGNCINYSKQANSILESLNGIKES